MKYLIRAEGVQLSKPVWYEAPNEAAAKRQAEELTKATRVFVMQTKSGIVTPQVAPTWAVGLPGKGGAS